MVICSKYRCRFPVNNTRQGDGPIGTTNIPMRQGKPRGRTYWLMKFYSLIEPYPRKSHGENLAIAWRNT